MKHIPNSLGEWLANVSVTINGEVRQLAGTISGKYLEGVERDAGTAFRNLPLEVKRREIRQASVIEANVLEWRVRKAKREAMRAARS